MPIKNTGKLKATLIGFAAILMWGFTGLQVVSLKHIPTFELISLGLGTSFILACLFIIRKKTWQRLKAEPTPMILATMLGICVASSSFMGAMQMAPPERVVLLNYLWPFIIVFLAPIISKSPFRSRALLGVLLAFIGLYYLLTNGKGIVGFEWQYWKGYALSVISTLAWGIYVLFSRKYHAVSSDLIGIYIGVAAITACIFHCALEPFVMPTLRDWLIIFSIGLTSQGLAYLFWDYGIKHGHYLLLCTASYFTPVLSISLLIGFGYSQFTEWLYMAIALILLGNFIVSDFFGKIFIPLKQPKT